MPRKLYTLDEAVAMIQEDDDEAIRTVNILPPESVDENTDEEEVEDGSVLPRDFAGQVEVEFHTESDPGLSENTSAGKRMKNTRKKKAEVTELSWKHEDSFSVTLESASPLPLLQTQPDLATKTPFQLFLHYFSDDVVNHLITNSETYAKQKNNHGFTLTKEDLYRFVGIILFSGYHWLPQQRMYWSTDEDLYTPLVSNAMSRNRFEEIKRFLHCADNSNLNTADKMAKIRPFLDLVNKHLMQFGVFSEALSLDEQMLPYFGKHSCKQFIKNKPVKFGYKYWFISSKDGYPFQFEVYCGRNVDQDASPLGERVVYNLLNRLEISEPREHSITFDNFFCSLDVLSKLRNDGFRATGTLRKNRTKNCPLADLPTADRGAFDFQTSGAVLVVKWNDNRIVHVASNHGTVEPILQTKRYSQKEKRHVYVPQPNVIGHYNATMGGVDLTDRFLSDYRPAISGKKWYFPHIIHMFNLFCVASWRISCELDQKWSHLEFRRHISRALLQVTVKNRIPSGPRGDVNEDVRYGSSGHSLQCIEKEGRCRLCSKNTRYSCTKCNVRLHQKCFFVYHEK